MSDQNKNHPRRCLKYTTYSDYKVHDALAMCVSCVNWLLEHDGLDARIKYTFETKDSGDGKEDRFFLVAFADFDSEDDTKWIQPPDQGDVK